MDSIDSSRAAQGAWWRPATASALVYLAATAVLGRGILAHLSTRVTSDLGDPLFTTAILKWNATHVPLTDAWWQFPIFFPTRDGLTFSEHLLGISVIASPLEWITGSPLVTYNVVTLLTFPLCAIAMYAFVYRLTRSAAGAFVAGVVYGFAPYRMSQLPHVQMLVAFYAPIALLGLHAYLDTGRRRWLALYGASWMLQGAANGYCLFFFSALVALWGLWFVVARRRWRALVEIALATVVAAIPLAPVLAKYVAVHAFQGFVRNAGEIREFSADVAGVLCAPVSLLAWGWIRIACKNEGELFPGVATFALFLIGFLRVVAARRAPEGPRGPRALAVIARLVFAIGIAYTAVVLVVAIAGPVRIDWGVLHVSMSSIRKSSLIAIGALIVAIILTASARQDDRRLSTLAFYVLAAIVMWVLALGPSIMLMGTQVALRGPFAWLMSLPGGDSLRVPARFWLMTIICLAVVAGIVVADLLRQRQRIVTAAAVVLLGCLVFADGAVAGFRWAPAPARWPNERVLQGSRVMYLPLGADFDIEMTYRAAIGGWSSVNGYSGYLPAYYLPLIYASRQEDPALFEPFQRYGRLEVIVRRDSTRLQALVAQQPGATMTGSDDVVVQYELPARPVRESPSRGAAVPISRVSASCANGTEGRAMDGDVKTAWLCPQTSDETFTIDLGRDATVGAVRTALGIFADGYPRRAIVETSMDAAAWREVWSGSTLAPLVWSSLEEPTRLPLTMSFPPTSARFVRLRQTGRDPKSAWAIAELQVFAR